MQLLLQLCVAHGGLCAIIILIHGLLDRDHFLVGSLLHHSLSQSLFLKTERNRRVCDSGVEPDIVGHYDLTYNLAFVPSIHLATGSGETATLDRCQALQFCALHLIGPLSEENNGSLVTICRPIKSL
ncbi:MAG: hypothetical protein [Circular genetic element sp.]|nr:MAG: hypothetical protein [Circular genetic element sp.]